MNKHKFRLFLILGIAGLLIVVVAFIVLISWHSPLSSGLHLPGFATNATLPFQSFVTPAAPGDSASGNSGQTVCNQSGVKYILAIGEDYRGGGGDYLYGLSDVIRIVRVDFSTSSVSMLAIPRDLWVHIPELADQNIDYGKINQAYFFGTPAMGHYKGSGGGAGLLADTLYYNFGIFPDHYVDVSMSAFSKIVDAVGGIDVTLTEPVDGNVSVDGSTQHMGYYPAGTNHFDGATALKFARIRYGYTELKRIDNQTIIIKAIYDKITSSGANVDVLGVADTFLKDDTVLTDLSPADISDLYCLSKHIQTADIKLLTLPSDSFTAQSVFSTIQNAYVFAYVPDTAKVTQFIQDFKDGKLP
jgi:LCP family protein required for cell wall assembly